MSQRKKLYSDILFPELQKELSQKKDSVDIVGLFTVKILKKGKHVSTWYVTMNGRGLDPQVSQQKPQIKNMPKVYFTIEDSDLLKMITGGMNGIKAYETKKLKIKGDLQLVRKVERVFVTLGGVDKTMSYIRTHFPMESKLSNYSAGKSKL